MAVPALTISTQSPGVPPLDSTSLILKIGAGQSFAAPFVELAVVMNAPVPFGQRPYVVATACAVHE